MSEQLKALAEQASSDVEWIVTHESGVVHKVTERLERLAEEAYALALLTAAGPTDRTHAITCPQNSLAREGATLPNIWGDDRCNCSMAKKADGSR